MGLPGEPTSWLGNRLGREMRQWGTQEVMVAGVCGDSAGYLKDALSFWPRRPRFDEPRLFRGRLLLRENGFAWAPQEDQELGRGPWVRLEDAATGDVLHGGGRPLDDPHQRFLLEFTDDEDHIGWRWSVMLDDWQHLVGPAGALLAPGPARRARAATSGSPVARAPTGGGPLGGLNYNSNPTHLFPPTARARHETD